MCHLYEILYFLIPGKHWKSWLIHIHFDRCPYCRKKTAEYEEMRHFLANDDTQDEQLTQHALRQLDRDSWDSSRARRRKSDEHHWALLGTLTATVLTIFLIAFFRIQSHSIPRNSQLATAAPESTFTLISAQIDDKTAQTYIIQGDDPRMVVVWYEGV